MFFLDVNGVISKADIFPFNRISIKGYNMITMKGEPEERLQYVFKKIMFRRYQ